MDKRGTDRTWLEPVLRRHLQRTKAPRGLWEKVALPRATEHRQKKHRFVWSLAAASALTASVLAVAWGHYPKHGSSRLEFRSERAADVRQWVRDHTGVDVPLLAPARKSIEMAGSSIRQDDGHSEIIVRYRAGGHNALLVVSTPEINTREFPEHNRASFVSIRAVRSVSWNMAGRAYTLSVDRTGDLQAACLVCHVENGFQTSWN